MSTFLYVAVFGEGLVVADKAHVAPAPWLGVLLLQLTTIPLILAIGSYLYRRVELGTRLTRKHEGGFFKRNAERIIFLLLGTAVTTAVGFLLKLLGLKI